MDQAKLEHALKLAEMAVTHAQDTRAAHRKRSVKANRQRQADIKVALTRLRKVMAPIRGELARIPYVLRQPGSAHSHDRLTEQRERLLEASDNLQRERRKLWKMQQQRKAGRNDEYRGTRW